MINKDRQSARRHIENWLAATAMTAVALAMAGGTDLAFAQSNGTQQSVRKSEIDHSTNEWLALQRGNTSAAPVRPMLGAEAGLAYRRYLESFNSKIPEFYSSSVSASGGSGSQGGGMPQN
jgi:hypothetical protein